MAAAAAARNTQKKATQGVKSAAIQLKMKASTQIWKGTMVVVDDTTGLAEPATAATGKTMIGAAQESVLSDGSTATYIWVERGIFYFLNKAGDLVDDTCRGRLLAAVEDNQTVRKTATSSIYAGKVIDLDSNGVWVEFVA